jgi:hypothetical protein
LSARADARARATLSVADWLPPERGAVGQYALLEARRRAAAGGDVRLLGLTTGAPSVEAQSIGAGRLAIVRLRARPLDRRRPLARLAWTLATDLRLALAARRLAAEVDEVRFTGSPPLLESFLVPLVRRRLVYRLSDFHPECSIAARGAATLPLRLALAWTRAVRRRVDRFEVLGLDARRRLVASGVPEAKIEVVELGPPVEVAPGTAPLPRPAALAGRTLLLYSGNFGIAHERATLLDGFRRHHRDGAGSVGLWLNATGLGADEVERALAADGLPVLRTPPVPLERLAALLATPDAHLVTLRAEFWGYVVPSKIFGCLASGKDLLFVGPEESDVDRLARERLPPDAYRRVDCGDGAGCAAALDWIATRAAAGARPSPSGPAARAPGHRVESEPGSNRAP